MSKYKILPVKIENKVCEGWEDVDSQLPIHPFCVLCQAPPKSGKSNLICNFVLNPDFDWIHRFDQIIWVSPTVTSDKTTKPIRDLMAEPDNELGAKIKLFTDVDKGTVDTIITQTVALQKKNPDDKTLIILDDCLGALKNNAFGKLCSKYRHDNLSVLAISQTFRSFDATARTCASGFIFFKTYNKNEKKKIIEEMNAFPDFEQLYDKGTKAKYSFLWVNVDTQEIWQNFDELLWKKD